MFRIVRYGAAAAAVLLAVLAGAFWLLDRNASMSFADMVENVKKAKSVSFVVKQKIGDQPELESRMFIWGNFMRYETPNSTGIIHFDQKKGRELNWPIDQLRNWKEDAKDHVKSLGDEEVGGRKCHVYQIKGMAKSLWFGGDQFKLWADAKIGLPVQIHFADDHTSVTWEDFLWDEPLNEDLFNMDKVRGPNGERPTPAPIIPSR